MAVPALAPALPEILVAIGAMALLMAGVFAGERSARAVAYGALALLGVVFVILLLWPAYGSTFGGAFILDPFARMMKLLALIGSGFALWMSIDHARRHGYARFEFAILVLLATLGMMLMISAGDLIALYLGLELQSLALYVIAAIHRDDTKSTEAGLKYFVLGALSSGMLLYGASLTYGFTGQTSFEGIAAAVQAHGTSLGLVFGIVFVLAGLAFKISAVPFHMWTPDVYEGAPTPVTAFFAAAPKVAALALLTRIVVEGYGPATRDWQQIVIFMSVASMALGAFAAIGQRNIKRLMAYSSIGHMGYALVGLAAGTQQGVESVVVYITVYLAMTLGAFACILSMRRNGVEVEDISELAGLSRTNPVMAFLLSMIMFSLAGIPPLAGFFGKLYVFLASVEAGLVTLAVIGAIASVVGAYYYLRIVKIIYFDEPAPAFEPMTIETKVVLGLAGAFVIVYALVANPVGNAAATAAKSLF